MNRYTGHALFLVLLLQAGSYCKEPLAVEARGGRLDLTAFPPAKRYLLKGEWKYWRNPDFDKPSPAPQVVRMPHLWGDRFTPGSGQGWALYQLHVTLPRPGIWTIRIFQLNTAGDLWVNRQKVMQIGQFGTDEMRSIPSFRNGIASFNADRTDILLLLRVSNFHDRFGGVWECIEIGENEAIQLNATLRGAEEFAFAAILALFGINHLLMARRWPLPLPLSSFGLFCLVMASQVVFSGEHAILRLFPEIPWVLDIRMQLITYYLSVPTFLISLETEYRQERFPLVREVIVSLSLIFTFIALCSDPRFFSHLLSYFHFATTGTAFYLIGLLVNAIKHHRHGSAWRLTGFFLLFIFTIHDMLVGEGYLSSPNLITIAVCVYASINILVITDQMARTHRKAHLLSLSFRKTSAVLRQNRKNLESARYRALKHRLQPHFLFNALNTIHGLLPASAEPAARLLVQMTDAYRYLTEMSERDLVDIRQEWQFLSAYVDLQAARFHGLVHISLPQSYPQLSLPPLLLQPLVENCFKHGFPSLPPGTVLHIQIRIRAWKDGLFFQVLDNACNRPVTTPQTGTYKNLRARLNFHFQNVTLSLKNNTGKPGLAASLLFWGRKKARNQNP